MTGLIWFVQIVHYPLFLRVGADAFRTFSAEHQRRTTRVVAPLMLLEIATATGLVLRLTQDPERRIAWIGLALVGVAEVVWVVIDFLRPGPARRSRRPARSAHRPGRQRS